MGKIPWWVWLGLAGGVGYVIYKVANKIPQAASAATNAMAQGIANVWLSLPVVGLGSGQTVLGSAKLPDGSLVPLNSLIGNIRQDTNTPANVYASINGSIYQLSPSDSQGNYPAALIGATPAAAAGGW